MFDGSNWYGNVCGDGGKVEGRIALDNILKQKNYLKLNDWLQSANVEKQVYAIDGLYQIRENGYLITPHQQNLIELIRNKKGEVGVCQGCVFTSASIGAVVMK